MRKIPRSATLSVSLGYSLFFAAVLCPASAVIFAQTVETVQTLQPRTPASAAESYGKLPLAFEANQGQADSQVRFQANGPSYSIFLTGSEAVLAIGRPGAGNATPDAIRMRLAGASANPAPIGESPLPGKANYFLGKDPSHWHTEVPTFARVRYSAVYPGIDLVYYGNQRQLEYDFIVAPGASPAAVRLHFSGASQLHIDSHGNLLFNAGDRSASFQKPILYQESDGRRQPVSGHFRLVAANTVAFIVGRYDRSRPLIIDPILVYSTYLGGTGKRGFVSAQSLSGYGDQANGIAVDKDNNAYVVGLTTSSDFPITNDAYQDQNKVSATHTAGPTVFISKLNPTGTALVYSTYLGGTGQLVNADGLDLSVGDLGFAIALDSSGNAYITGTTFSSDFPITPGALQAKNLSAPHQLPTAFVTKLNPTGNTLVYSTYLGGTNHIPNAAYGGIFGDVGQAIAVDASGNAFVAGYTDAADFPTTPGVLETKNAATANHTSNAFISKLNPAGTALVYSTLLGGSGYSYTPDPEVVVSLGDSANAIALDASGNAYVTGQTYSTDFPVSANAYQKVAGGAPPSVSNAFVTKLNSTGTKATYSTFLSGADGSYASAIAVDASGTAYVAGSAGYDFPVTNMNLNPSALYSYSNGFVTRLNATGSALLYSTQLTHGAGSVTGLAVDASGYAYLAGTADRASFPSTPDAIMAHDFLPGNASDYNNFDDAYILKLNPSGNAVDYATLFGDTTFVGTTSPTALALGSNGSVYVTGVTSATKLLTSTGAFQPASNAISYGTNAFMAALSLSGETSSHFPSLISLAASATTFNPGSYVTLTATVTPAAGASRATGTVTFFGGIPNTNVALNTSGTATLTVSNLTPGVYTVYAFYNGDATHLSTSQNVYGETLPVTFRAIGPPASLSFGTNNPYATYGHPFGDVIAQVMDADSYPLESVTVKFTGAGLTFNPASGYTNFVGSAYTQPTATKVGSYTVTASVAGLSQTPTVNLTLGPAPLTVTVVSPTARLYGAANPAFTNKITGLVGADAVTAVDSTTATIGSPVGSYPVTATVSAANPGTALSNYQLTIVPAQLNVHAALLTVTAVSYKSTYGHAPAEPTAYNLTGFVNGDTASVVNGAPVLSTTVTAATVVGNYPIQIALGTLTASNYSFARDQTKGYVEVEPAPLTATAISLTMQQGTAVPSLTYALTGFVNGDTAASAVTGAPTLTTTATSTSKPGKYPITLTLGTLKAKNYSILKVNGILTVQ